MFNIHKGIKNFLNTIFEHPQGKEAQRIEVLSCFIHGLIKKQQCDLQVIAGQMPPRTELRSRVRQLETWLDSEHNSWTVRYLPFLSPVLSQLSASNAELVFIMDGSEMGQGCMTLMLSLLYKKRSIPICWLVKKGKKGHLPQSMHLELLSQLFQLSQSKTALRDKKIVILGDGEFDGGELTQFCQEKGWTFVVRTAHNTLLYPAVHNLDGAQQADEAQSFNFNEVSQIAYDKGADDGHFWAIMPQVYYTEKKYGRVNAVFWHDKNYHKPLFLLSNLELAFDAYDYYKKRFAIETLFGDLKSRGFNIHLSKIDQPKRLARLLIAVCVAFLITWAAGKADNLEDIKPLIMDKKKNSLSVFQIGARVWDFCINNHIEIILSKSMNFTIIRI